MVQFKILGSAELRNNAGILDHSFLTGPKRLALLVYLVLKQSRGYQRRDHLLPLLWPDQGQKSARNSLSNMLYHIRTSLGKNAIIIRGNEELSINPEEIWCDAVAFQQAVQENNWNEAIRLYNGKLLEGFYIPKISPEFEQWLDNERKRIQTGYTVALEKLALSAEKNKMNDEAAEYWKRCYEVEPFNTRIAGCLVKSLALSGKSIEAKRMAEEHGKLLGKEFGTDSLKIIEELTRNLPAPAPEFYVSQTQGGHVRSIAVLPFEEFGQNPDTSNFANGLHHDLLTRLSSVTDLKVISRTSVLRYRNTSLNLREIARELEVDTIVEGGVQESGGHMRLHVQVIDAKSDDHQSAETYDRKLTHENFFEVQAELAEKITETLQTQLTPHEKKRVTEWTPTENPEAYRFYTMGRKQLDQRTELNMKKSLNYFHLAIEKDPVYALAWVGLADAQSLLYDYGYQSAEESLPKAEKAVKEALKLDPDLAEAHASKGLLHSNRHESNEAIQDLLVAVDLKPNYAEAHNWLSWNYQLLGNAEKALLYAKQAVELDPLSPESVSNLSVSYLYNGHSDKALTEALRAYDLQPEWATPVFYKALALYDLGKYHEAISDLENLVTPWAGEGPLATKACIHLALGQMDQVHQLRNYFRDNGQLFAAGLIYAALGETDVAIDHFLKIEYWDDWPTLSYYHLYPNVLAKVRNHPLHSNIIRNVKKSRER